MKLPVDRLSIVLEYLQKGGELRYAGRTYVWLNDYVTHETEDAVWGIDGLAIKGRQYSKGENSLDPNAGEDYFMGVDMPVNNFFNMIINIDKDEMIRILKDLKEIRKQNQ